MKVPSALMMLVVWWCAMVLVMAVEADVCDDEEIRYKDYSSNTVSFDVMKGANCYPKFLTRIRNKVEAPTRACGFPSTRSNPLSGEEYLTVNLKFSNTKWVTLGLDAKDLYIWGYQDTYNGALRATFVNDTPEAARTSLFQSAVTKRTTTFKGDYGSLERFAKIEKITQALNVAKLGTAIQQVYGKPETQLNNANEAKFFLLVIQMVSEAARFKFIENAIHDDKDDQSEYFKLKLSDYVNDWDKISNAIHRAELQPINKCTIIDPPIKVGKGDTKLITEVEELQEDMALLKYKDASLVSSEFDAVM